MATSRGIDVSAHQKRQNWTKHKEGGVTFAFAKASEGQNSRDKMFDTHIADIIKAGLIPGAYHFAWPNQDPDAEAANYIGAVRPYTGGPFMHWLDLERYSDGRNYKNRTAHEIQQWAARWIQQVRDAFPHNFVGIYTSGSDIQAGRVPNGVPLWYPAYPVPAITYTAAEKADKPKPGITPIIWQFTSTPIDRSIAYASPEELRALANKRTSGQEKGDDMKADDNLKSPEWAKKKWPGDKEIQDGIHVSTALAGGYFHARSANDGVKEILAALEALTAELSGLRSRVHTLEGLLKAKE